MAAVVAAAASLSACGGGARLDASEPSGTYSVQVSQATFPAKQRLSQHTHLVIVVRNAGSKTIPDVAVTITDPPWGTTVQPFGRRFTMPGVAYQSRPVWIIDAPPGPCHGVTGYSCRGGGFGGAVTVDTNTWALGQLRPGATAVFDWGVTAVQPGRYTVAYRVAAGLNGKAKAQLSGGGVPAGSFDVAISQTPAQAYVNNSGQIVTAH